MYVQHVCRILCLVYIRGNRTPVFKTSHVRLISSQNILPKSLRVIKVCFDNSDEPQCSSGLAVVFALLLFHFLSKCLSDNRVMHRDFFWCKKGLQLLRCCPWVFCDFLDESSLCSWRNIEKSASFVFPFGGNSSHCGSLRFPKSFNIAF